MIRRFFELDAHGTTVRTELLAGLTTFLTMAYIVVVNPVILGAAGVPVADGARLRVPVGFGVPDLDGRGRAAAHHQRSAALAVRGRRSHCSDWSSSPRCRRCA
jgi:hypothetical protein